MDEIISIDCRFLVALEELPQVLFFDRGNLLSGYPGDTFQFGLSDPLVRPLEATHLRGPWDSLVSLIPFARKTAGTGHD